MNRHAVFVSASLPPRWDSQTIRSLYLLSAAREFPFRFTFVSPEASDDCSSASRELVPEGTRIVTTDPPAHERRVASVAKKFGKGASWLYSNLVYRIAVPDTFYGWDRVAERALADIHLCDPIDVVLSASGSATAHMAASRFSVRTGVPWAADYGDPWSILDRAHRPFAALFSSTVEEQTIGGCSHLVFTTEQTLKAYRDWLGDSLPPATVLPYGYRKTETEALGPSKCVDRIEIAHIGVAFRGNRDLGPLICAVGERDSEYRLTVLGNHSPQFREAAKGLTDARFSGRVPYEEANRAMAESDVLVVIGNKGPLQVPGKAYVAMGTQKIVLYIGQRPAETDPTHALLSPLPGVVCCRNDVASIGEGLDHVTNDLDGHIKRAASRPGQESVKAVEAHELSRRFLGTVLDLCDGGDGQ